MKKNYSIVFSFSLCSLAAVVLSCSDIDNTLSFQEERNYVGCPNGQIEKQRSSSDAIAIVSDFRSRCSTRSSIPEEIVVDYVLSGDIISDSVIQEQLVVDTMLYILNVNDSDGFYLVSGDRMMPDIVGYSDNGHFSWNCEQTEEANSYILNLYANYYLSSIEVPFDPIDPTHPVDPWLPPVAPWHPDSVVIIRDYIDYSPWYTLDSISPLVPVEWNQGYPFNAKLVDPATGHLFAAGCLPIAVAQLLTYYRRPTGSFMDYIINDWDLITGPIPSLIDSNYGQYASDVSTLVQWICEGLNCNYGLYSTTAYMSDVPPFLSTVGFNHPSSVCSYDSTTIVQSLRQQHPVIVFGTDQQDAGSGHAWVVDGLILKHRTVTYRNTFWGIINEYDEYQTMLHCNWGFQNASNGYYLERVFDVYHNVMDPDLDADYYYKYNMSMIPNAY